MKYFQKKKNEKKYPGQLEQFFYNLWYRLNVLFNFKKNKCNKNEKKKFIAKNLKKYDLLK